MSLTSIVSNVFKPRQKELEKYLYDAEHLQHNVLMHLLEKGKNKIEKPKVSLNEPLTKLLEISLEYINENRFNAVVSKEGEVNIKMIGKIAGLMTQDIVVDLSKDENIENLESLGEVSEVKKFKQTLHGEVIGFIRPLLLKLD